MLGEAGETVLRFNGYLFKDTSAIALNAGEIGLLIEAAKHKWNHVEPAIFGTLLERALDGEGARQARRALHAARLRGAAGPADDHGAAARRLGRGRRPPPGS